MKKLALKTSNPDNSAYAEFLDTGNSKVVVSHLSDALDVETDVVETPEPEDKGMSFADALKLQKKNNKEK